jgi:hypothetical protein
MKNNTYAIARIVKSADMIKLNDLQAKGLHILQARRLCEDLNRGARESDCMAGDRFHIVNLGAM